MGCRAKKWVGGPQNILNRRHDEQLTTGFGDSLRSVQWHVRLVEDAEWLRDNRGETSNSDWIAAKRNNLDSTQQKKGSKNRKRAFTQKIGNT